MPEQVRCKWCGLLGVRNAADSLVYPASERIRETAELPLHEFPGAMFPGRGVSIMQIRDKLICYVGKPEFVSQSATLNPLEIIDSCRECESFIPCIPGRTPEQHLNMRELQEQRAHNARMLNEERQWREQQAEKDRTWKELDRDSRATEAQNTEMRHQQNSTDAERRFWLGFGAAMLVALASQAASVGIQRQWPPPTAPVAPPVVNVTVQPSPVIAAQPAAQPQSDTEPTPTID